MSDKVDLTSSCAVLVIHGIGEQKPGATIRGFVKSVLKSSKEPKFFSKPDHLSKTFELRTYQNREKPKTHLYEYYWAHQSSGTQFSHVRSWLANLLLRWPGGIPKAMRGLYFLLWGSIALFGIALVTGVGEVFSTMSFGMPLWMVSGMAAILGAVLNMVVLNYLGDAARYLSPSPKNVKMRHAIRSEGTELLRKLHEKGYGRIVIVGHSLGSVIAYDIIRQVWDELNQEFSREKANAQEALGKVEELGENLRNAYVEGEETADLLSQYQAAQRELSREMAEIELEWRVTDFITAGSPLAHAALLMADGEKDLRERQAERELLTSPPDPETRDPKRPYSYLFYEKGKEKIRTMHGAAAFAFTRWTNLYFPAKWGLFGDFIGGEMRPTFGSGIRDVAVTSGWLGGLGKHTPLAHTRYWSDAGEGDGETALKELVDALDLGWKDFGPKREEGEES